MIEGLILGLHLFSHHAPDKGQNNTNPGIYFETKEGWTGGLYKNSFKRTSVYFGHMFYANTEMAKFGIQVGLVTGYKKKTIHYREEWSCYHVFTCSADRTKVEGFSKHNISPAGAFFYKRDWLKVSWIPPIKDHSSVIHLGIERAY